MGGTSTLQSATLSDGVNINAASFDLRSWQGLTLVLKMGKEYLTEPGAYAEFRNLVLQYAQQGGDVEIKKQIDAVIATFGKTPKNLNTVAAPHDVADAAPKKLVVESVTSVQSTEDDIEAAAPKVIGRRKAPRFGVIDEERKDDSANASIPQEISQAPVAIEPAVEDAPVVTHTVTPTFIPESVAAQDVPRSLEEYRARTAEIKRSVHEHIGNPVALMGTKDGKGKVYMTALLNALKATGAGAGGGADDAMVVLEQAYADLIASQAVSSSKETKAEDVAVPVQTPSEDTSQPAAVPVVVPVSDIPEVKETKAEEVVVPVQIIPEDVALPVEPSEPASIPDVPEVHEEVVIPPLPIKREAIRSAFKRSDSAISTVVSAVHRNKHSVADTLSGLIDMNEGNETSELKDREESSAHVVPPALLDVEKLTDEPIEETVVVEEQKEEPIVSEAEREKDEKPYEAWASRGKPLPLDEEHIREEGIDLKQVAVKQSELSSPHISTMLDTLLLEWNIFSGSGLFGVGPGGLAHPLFRKLAPLSMGEVLAGRWEGTDPKTVKVIKQYVDAWRHEQGITYTIHETFEHYLRRVVQRILKRQEG